MIKKIAKWKGRIARGIYPICYLCGKPIKKVGHLSQEHLLPKSRGGQTIDSNLLPAHKVCNSLKGNMTVVEWFDMINGQNERN